MVLLDLHGYITPMLIEPCTPPHNPNYEYDLYIKWALYEAKAMAAELLTKPVWIHKSRLLKTQAIGTIGQLTYTPMYAMYHGSLGIRSRHHLKAGAT